MRSWLLLPAAAFTVSACATAPDRPSAAALALAPPQQLELVDSARARRVPVALYGAEPGRAKPLALISHGYGAANTAYSFLARALLERGYVVASVQHELAGDSEMPTSGEPRIVRRPFWDRGVANLEFAIRELRARGLAGTDPVLLVGHSNGGDTSALFATQYPGLVAAVFTLDNRRMPLPRTARPRICSARSSDQPADPGVLPSPDEQARLAMVIATVPVRHNDMGDGASDAQQAAILALLGRCLAR